MFSLLLVFIFFCSSLVYFSTCYFFAAKADTSDVPPPPTPSRHYLQLFTTLARLAQISYCTSRVVQDDSGLNQIAPIEPPTDVEFDRGTGSVKIFVVGYIESYQSSYRCVMTYENDSVWLFKPMQAGLTNANYILVFRGTRVLEDLISDFELFLSVTRDTDTGLRDFQNRTYESLKLIFRDNGITFEDRIILVGHSLGGTVAEMMLLRLLDEQYSNVTAYCFDTPGLPHFFRAKFPPLLERTPPELVLLNADDNLVNNLTAPPPHASVYHVGRDTKRDLSKIGKYLRSAPKLGKFVYDTAVGALDSHDLESVAEHLKKGEFRLDTASSRRLFPSAIRSILGFAEFVCRLFVPSTPSKIGDNRGKVHDIPVCQFTPDESRVDSAFGPFPGVSKASDDFLKGFSEYVFPDNGLAEFGSSFPGHSEVNYNGEIGKSPLPYSLGDDVSNFARMLTVHNDVVIPFVGFTSIGKTSLIKALFNDGDDAVLRVSATLDTTQETTVMLWKILNYNEWEQPAEESLSSGSGSEGAPSAPVARSKELRIWLMDMRGVHAAKENMATGERYETVLSQLNDLCTVVQAAVFVSGSPIHESLKLFKEVCHAVKGRVIVARNYKDNVNDAKEKKRILFEAKKKYRTVFNRLNFDGRPAEEASLRVILTKVYRNPGALPADHQKEENIRVLEEEIGERLSSWKNEIEKDVKLAREEENRPRGWTAGDVGGAAAAGVGAFFGVASGTVFVLETAAAGSIVAGTIAAAPVLGATTVVTVLAGLGTTFAAGLCGFN